MNKLEVEHIYMNYHSLKGETEAIKDISFIVKEGEFVSIVGPSGCGKSTLLNIIAGLLQPSGGKIYINGKSSKNNLTSVGYMFQRDHLFEWLTVFDNLCLGLKVQKRLNEENIQKVNALLKNYNLDEFKNYYPGELSGGMRQRVALIRTLALEPEVLFLDEPFSALDYQTRIKVSEEIYGIIKNERKTTIMVTHDIAEAITMSDRIIILSKRPAIIKKDINIEFNVSEPSPFKRREDERFRLYFNSIWKELEINE